MLTPAIYVAAGLVVFGLLSMLLRRIDWQTRRIPRELELKDAPGVPSAGLSEALERLRPRWEALGFSPPSGVFYVSEDAHLVVVQNPEERVVCALAWDRLGEVAALHLITPLSDARRVETSSLDVLQGWLCPPEVTLQLGPEDLCFDELWAAHRRALMNFERRERQPIDDWRALLATSYRAWIAAGVRVQRLARDVDPTQLRLRDRAP